MRFGYTVFRPSRQLARKRSIKDVCRPLLIRKIPPRMHPPTPPAGARSIRPEVHPVVRAQSGGGQPGRRLGFLFRRRLAGFNFGHCVTPDDNASFTNQPATKGFHVPCPQTRTASGFRSPSDSLWLLLCQPRGLPWSRMISRSAESISFGRAQAAASSTFEIEGEASPPCTRFTGWSSQSKKRRWISSARKPP